MPRGALKIPVQSKIQVRTRTEVRIQMQPVTVNAYSRLYSVLNRHKADPDLAIKNRLPLMWTNEYEMPAPRPILLRC